MDYARILEDVGFNATHTRNQYCIFICKIELHELYMFSYNGSSWCFMLLQYSYFTFFWNENL